MPDIPIQIEQIRYELTWHIRHKVMYPDLPFESIKLEKDPNGIHFGLYAEDIITSVVSVFNDDNIYQFRKLATLSEEQGKGYGTLLLQYVISFVRKEGGVKLWCNARVSASHFYTKFGFLPHGAHFVQNKIDFVIMELELDSLLDA